MNLLQRRPNVLVTGTPGVGKSKLCQQLVSLTDIEWVNIGKVAEEHKCYEEFDETYGCPILDEDLLIDILDPQMRCGGNVVDYHSSEFFPKRWFDLVLVLTADTKQLHDRLTARGYTGKKLEDNIQCEIFGILLEEAKESYDEDKVFVLSSNTEEEAEMNVKKLIKWVENWQVSKPPKFE